MITQRYFVFSDKEYKTGVFHGMKRKCFNKSFIELRTLKRPDGLKYIISLFSYIFRKWAHYTLYIK